MNTAAKPEWSRIVVEASVWTGALEALAEGALSLVSLWGEPGWVHMALAEAPFAAPTLLSLACPTGRFPSVGARHAPAQRLERAMIDMTGLIAEGAVDHRPWLDHGRWDQRPPGHADPGGPAGPAPYAFRTSEGPGLHQIPVGPVHAGIIEPGHFRFTVNGETVVRLEPRLGYAHRGLIARMIGQPIAAAARLAARASGDSTVAYALAFARAVEAAIGLEPPPRAHWLRALMAELERLANHLGDFGAICTDAAFGLIQAHCAVLREEVLRAAGFAFGHRLMMDLVVPGGVTTELDRGGAKALADLLVLVRERMPLLTAAYDDTASLQERTVGTGVLSVDLARQFAAGGYVGRASGRDFDARRALAYAPYDQLEYQTPRRTEGDVNARVWVRIEEIGQSLGLIEQILGRLPAGGLLSPPPMGSGEGGALVEGFRGDIFAWVRVEDGHVIAAHLRDPSWFHWPLLEAAIEGNIVADFPLCNKSFNASYAGADL